VARLMIRIRGQLAFGSLAEFFHRRPLVCRTCSRKSYPCPAFLSASLQRQLWLAPNPAPSFWTVEPDTGQTSAIGNRSHRFSAQSGEHWTVRDFDFCVVIATPVILNFGLHEIL
jgi:hypothetical protein